MSNTHNLYEQVIAIAHTCLGADSKRFIDRQIINHLGKAPEQLTPQDLSQLLDWMRATAVLLNEDKKVTTEFIDQLRPLIKQPNDSVG